MLDETPLRKSMSKINMACRTIFGVQKCFWTTKKIVAIKDGTVINWIGEKLIAYASAIVHFQSITSLNNQACS